MCLTLQPKHHIFQTRVLCQKQNWSFRARAVPILTLNVTLFSSLGFSSRAFECNSNESSVLSQLSARRSEGMMGIGSVSNHVKMYNPTWYHDLVTSDSASAGNDKWSKHTWQPRVKTWLMGVDFQTLNVRLPFKMLWEVILLVGGRGSSLEPRRVLFFPKALRSETNAWRVTDNEPNGDGMLLPLDWNVCPSPGHKARLSAGPRWQKHAFLKPTRWRLCVSYPLSHCHMSVCWPGQRRHGSMSHSSRVVSFMALTFNHSYYTWTACAVTHSVMQRFSKVT